MADVWNEEKRQVVKRFQHVGAAVKGHPEKIDHVTVSMTHTFNVLFYTFADDAHITFSAHSPMRSHILAKQYPVLLPNFSWYIFGNQGDI